MSTFQNDSIFWIEIEKIKPNPYQPRKEFNEARLRELSDSIRQYGILQPLTVTRKEYTKDDGGIGVEYELIAGERRLRASKLAGLLQAPVIIRRSEDDDRAKLELAIIENLQREDLNPIDRARAFAQLAEEFGLTHGDVGKRVGRSREYVSNTIRLLALPQEILDAVSAGKLTEGHARPILMLADRPEEQVVLFKEVLFKKLTVRETEGIARRVAYERVRKKDLAADPELVELEEKFTERLGTRVRIERKDVGGKLVIDFFSSDDLHGILSLMNSAGTTKEATELLSRFIEKQKGEIPRGYEMPETTVAHLSSELGTTRNIENERETVDNLDDKPSEEKNNDMEGESKLYSLKNFTI